MQKRKNRIHLSLHKCVTDFQHKVSGIVVEVCKIKAEKSSDPIFVLINFRGALGSCDLRGGIDKDPGWQD